MTPPDRPLQLGELLSETVRVYSRAPAGRRIGLGLVEGGAFLLAALTPDLLDVLVIALAFRLIFAAAARLVSGDSFVEAWAQVGVRTPVLVVLTFVVAVPAVIALTSISSCSCIARRSGSRSMGFSIPVADARARARTSRTRFDRIAYSLLRSIRLARAEYLHALGVVAALVIVYLVFGIVLGVGLVGFADNGSGRRRRARPGRPRALLLPRPVRPLLRATGAGRCILASPKPPREGRCPST